MRRVTEAGLREEQARINASPAASKASYHEEQKSRNQPHAK
jgi:hypothetical protein